MDIVERLQELIGVYIGDADIDEDLLDAKTEIERLRRDVDRMACLAIDNAKDTLRLQEALHRISLGSQDSGTTKEPLGREARAALKDGE